MILMVILALGALVGWVMVVVAAFREHVLWGLGSIVFGLVQLIFAIFHWREAKTGFLMQLLCGALLGVVFAAGVDDDFKATLAQASMEQPYAETGAYSESAPGTGSVPSAFADDLSDIISENEVDAVAVEPVAPAPRIRYAYHDVTLSELRGKKRGKIEIQTKSGQRHAGEIVVVSANRIELRKRMQGGSFNMRIKTNDIERVRLWGQVQS
ncbi:MAG: hypothetical protein ACR2RL_17060 [Gammaproteobacteria bacterium]